MAINDNALVIPGHGTVFTAPANTALPAGGIAAFKNITAASGPSGWENLGHTSRENTLALSVDGGDATTLATWLKDAVHTTYATETWSMKGSSLQFDVVTLKMIYNGWLTSDGKGLVVPAKKKSQDLALVVISSDDTGNVGFYIPNASFSHGDAPSFDVENFFEAPFSSVFQSAASAALPADADGTPGLFSIYGPEAFEGTTEP